MEREANYTAVGAFVLLVTTMAALFVYWYAGSADARDYARYEIYFQGSVSGLNRGSTVRYLGVEVGRVVTIRIDKRASDRVQVIADIDAGTPISKNTLASMSLQGITGLLYIDLLPNADSKRRMDPVPSEQYPVIDSVQSNFDLFLASLPDLVGRAHRPDPLHRHKNIHHPVVGDVTLGYEVLALASTPGLVIMTYLTEPATPSADAMNLLRSWTADEAHTDDIAGATR